MTPGVYGTPIGKTWADVLPERANRYDPSLPVRGLFWHWSEELDKLPRRINVTWCPAVLADAVVAYVEAKHGKRPVEVLADDVLSLDPGGTVLYAKETRHYTGSVPYAVPFSLAGVTAASLGPETGRTYGGVPCRRLLSYTLTIVPEADLPGLIPWLEAIDQEFWTRVAADKAARGGQ